jgi:hypothetical protein
MPWSTVEAAITFTPDLTRPILPFGSTTLPPPDQAIALLYINQMYNGSSTAIRIGVRVVECTGVHPESETRKMGTGRGVSAALGCCAAAQRDNKFAANSAGGR